MIDDTQAEFIASRDIKKSDDLIKLLNHYKTAWQYEDYYKILFDSALEGELKILPANIERKKLYNIIRHDKNKLPIETERLMSEVSLTADLENSLQKEIVESHCGMIEKETAKPMMTGQQIRDCNYGIKFVE